MKIKLPTIISELADRIGEGDVSAIPILHDALLDIGIPDHYWVIYILQLDNFDWIPTLEWGKSFQKMLNHWEYWDTEKQLFLPKYNFLYYKR